MNPDQEPKDAEAEILGRIAAEALERRRSGERLTAAELAARHPHLREEIREHIEVLDLLDRAGPLVPGDLEASAISSAQIGEAIAALPERMQQVILLRKFENLRWPDVARRLGEPEEALRREYARTVRQLLARCAGGSVDQ